MRRLSGGPRDLPAFRVTGDTGQTSSLSDLIEREIIPRLLVAHTDGAAAATPERTGASIKIADVHDLAPLAMEIEADALLRHVEGILARGVAVETVMVELLAPTARLLGEWWEEDRCDFVDVTMALWRLQEIVHLISARGAGCRPASDGRHSALFAAMPSDQHDFGTVVIEEMFRRNGWTTDRLSGSEASELIKCVANQWFDLIGLTVSCDRHIADLPSIIVAVRNVSRNPHVCVMVGGRVFSANPQLAAQVGADGTARDAKLALRVATDLVRERARDVVACS